MAELKTCLYFPGTALEAIEYYVALLPNSEIKAKTFYPSGGPMPVGEVMTIDFELQGQALMAINGGPEFQFTPSISLIAYCEDQATLDRIWDGLADGGNILACGWLTDRFGVSWQIVPTCLPELMARDEATCGKVVQALWEMIKIDIAALQAAAD